MAVLRQAVINPNARSNPDISGPRASHSQIVTACQPSASRYLSEASSRSLFFRNFSFQNSDLDEGIFPIWHPSWWCQKQPLMKMAIRRLGSTMSGVPGRSRRCNRNRTPELWSNFRTMISGFVSLPLKRAINLRRTVGLVFDTTIHCE